MSVSRAAAASASGPKPPCFWIARGSTSLNRTQRLLKPIETCGAIAAVGALASYCALYRFTISAVSSPTPGLSFFGSRSWRSEEHTSELQSRLHLVCRLLLEKKKKTDNKKTVSNE